MTTPMLSSTTVTPSTTTDSTGNYFRAPLTLHNVQAALQDAARMGAPPGYYPSPTPGSLDMPGPATPCAMHRRMRSKSTVVLLPTGRAPLDNVLEILTMSGLVGTYVAAELEVPSVVLSRLRHDHLDDNGLLSAASFGSNSERDQVLWRLCGLMANVEPVKSWKRLPNETGSRWALWTYMTGHPQGQSVASLAEAINAYLRANKPPLVLARWLSGLSTGDFAKSLGLSRQRLHLISDRTLDDSLAAGYLAQAVRLHLSHLTNLDFWGEGRWPIAGGI